MKLYPSLNAVVIGVATGIAVAVFSDMGWPTLPVALLAAFLTSLVWWAVVDRRRGANDQRANRPSA